MELLAAVFGLALVDSVNPSAIGVTLYLLTGRKAVSLRVLTYVSAVFLAYFAIGVLLMLGLNVLSDAFDEYLYNPVAFAVQAAIGALMMLYGILAPDKKTAPRRPRSHSLGAVFLLGLTISIVEFSTALPYLAAIGLLTNAGLPAVQWAPILFFYNLVLVAPPLVLLGLYKLFGSRLEERFERYRQRVQASSRTVWLTLLAILGFLLLADSIRYFAEYLGFLPDLERLPSGAAAPVR